jgi:peptidoglycan/xylan/chitin deacetylase (PgdA/CDA1 family)
VRAEKIESFRRHMDYVLRAGKPVWADSNGLTPDDQRRIAVTFDDAFRSVIENALPILREREVPATIFVPTGYIGMKQGWINDPQDLNAEEEVLNETQLRELVGNLIKFGSHTVMHARLPHIGQREANRELVESKKILENILGKDVDLFAFPYGDFNKETIEMCIKAGYRHVFLNIPIRDSLSNNGIVCGRIDLSLDDWRLEYRLKMLGAYQWLAIAIEMKRRLLSVIGVNSGWRAK